MLREKKWQGRGESESAEMNLCLESGTTVKGRILFVCFRNYLWDQNSGLGMEIYVFLRRVEKDLSSE